MTGWSNGVMENWIVGVMECRSDGFQKPPTLQNSDDVRDE